jgi:hypothetical protein
MKTSLRFCRILAAILVLLVVAPWASAKVVRIEIQSHAFLAGGAVIPSVGPYEVIMGRLHHAVAPDHVANSRIVDLQHAPRDQNGMVTFTSDFCLLKPVDLAKGSHRLIYDVNNRGNKLILGHHNDTWGNVPLQGNGFLMRHGYSILWSGWNWDVVEGGGRMQIDLPIAAIGGGPIEQFIAAEIVSSFPRERTKSQPLAWGGSRCYPVVDPSDNSDATLTVRDGPRGERYEIPPNRWRFARAVNGQPVTDPVSLYLEDGFDPGRIYELVYKATNPRVVGLGLAAVRDAISFFRFETEDAEGTQNPLVTVDDSGQLQPDTQKAYIYGSSQSGRFITHMIWQGFHVDEAGRLVFDGARIHVAGGGKGGFNHRFAQTTHHPSHLEGNYMPADHPPFNYLPETHPGSGKGNDVLAVAKELGKIPSIMITLGELEYWTRSASLLHTNLDGTEDSPLHSKVRLYVVAGAPHGCGYSRPRGPYENSRNTIDWRPVSRATLLAMDRWVSDGVEPPPSRYPRIDRGELISPAEHRDRFPTIPGLRHLGRNLQPPVVDYGPHFWTEGIISVIPPKMGGVYTTLVPAFDEDGNGVGGIRLPSAKETPALQSKKGTRARRSTRT